MPAYGTTSRKYDPLNSETRLLLDVKLETAETYWRAPGKGRGALYHGRHDVPE